MCVVMVMVVVVVVVVMMIIIIRELCAVQARSSLHPHMIVLRKAELCIWHLFKQIGVGSGSRYRLLRHGRHAEG
jgi:hypothetical protein